MAIQAFEEQKNVVLIFFPAVFVHPIISIPMAWVFNQVEIGCAKIICDKFDQLRNLWRRCASVLMLFFLELSVLGAVIIMEEYVQDDVLPEKKYSDKRKFDICVNSAYTNTSETIVERFVVGHFA